TWRCPFVLSSTSKGRSDPMAFDIMASSERRRIVRRTIHRNRAIPAEAGIQPEVSPSAVTVEKIRMDPDLRRGGPVKGRIRGEAGGRGRWERAVGTPKGNRTPVPAVRGRCPDR